MEKMRGIHDASQSFFLELIHYFHVAWAKACHMPIFKWHGELQTY